MVTSRYAELVEVGKMAIKEEQIAMAEDQVLIRITHCGLCQYDGAYFQGIIGTPPLRLGHEPVGIVEAVGRHVHGVSVGERVTGLFAHLKAFATYAVAEPQELIRISRQIASEHALAEPLKCIATIVRSAPPQLGDHVLVMGCGFMGLLTLAGLVGKAPASLIAVDLLENRLQLAKAIGATHTLNAKDPNFLKQVQDITNGRGTDIVYEVTGNAVAAELGAKTLRPHRATYALAGWYGKPAQYTLRNWTTKGAIIVTPHPKYSLDPADDMRRAMNALARGVFPMEKLVTHSFPLDEIQKGFETMLSASEGYIKGVITP
ncbi:MAG: zinc-binding dehydrogenase [Candidatus Vecturithrix sp.]|jgi:threonine dehydrogenase-like Zn-dependent dehydrogenase|nr:zinc-binding dehydrogenase [Candidatus Vecturithrix sp.]